MHFKKILKEYIRKIIAEAPMVEPPSGGFIRIEINTNQLEIHIVDPTKSKAHWPGRILLKSSYTDYGYVWEVVDSFASKGYGPMLYDIAMEVISKSLVNGIGIMPDVFSVSHAARNIWSFYFNSRSDVKKAPNDYFENKFDLFENRPEYLRYYYFKTSTPIIDSLMNSNQIKIA